MDTFISTGDYIYGDFKKSATNEVMDNNRGKPKHKNILSFNDMTGS
jgi:phosphodiesterase/alkaline phosphatase D-like protein